MKPDRATRPQPIAAPFIHCQDCACPSCSSRHWLESFEGVFCTLAAGFAVGFVIVAASGRLEAALRALAGL